MSFRKTYFFAGVAHQLGLAGRSVAGRVKGVRPLGCVRLPASYCNFYIANGCVLVPFFDDPADEPARQLLQERFPDRQVIGLPARDIVWGWARFIA